MIAAPIPEPSLLKVIFIFPDLFPSIRPNSILMFLAKPGYFSYTVPSIATVWGRDKEGSIFKIIAARAAR
jgi:hypothetical protein